MGAGLPGPSDDMSPSPDDDEFVEENRELSIDEAEADEIDEGLAEVRGEELTDDRAEESIDEGTAERGPAISGDTRLKALPSFFPLPDEEELDEENDELSPVEELEDGDEELRDDDD